MKMNTLSNNIKNQSLTKTLVLSIWIIAVFLIADNGYQWQKNFGLLPEATPLVIKRWLSFVIWRAVPVITALWLWYGAKHIFTELGLRANVIKALGIAFFATLPMLLGYGFHVGWEMNISWANFLYGCVLAAFMEELLYRGFLFGQLYRRAKWPFWAAAILIALIFGMAHLYQGNDWQSMLGIFLITGIGGAWFAWLYVQWNYNLWVPIFFHFLMNFYWGLFDMDSTALGGWEANLYRGLTVVLSIVITRRMSGE